MRFSLGDMLSSCKCVNKNKEQIFIREYIWSDLSYSFLYLMFGMINYFLKLVSISEKIILMLFHINNLFKPSSPVFIQSILIEIITAIFDKY